MARLQSTLICVALLSVFASAQNNCYFGPGAAFRGPSNLVPCNSTAEISACCLQGDTCLTGNACYNYATGNTYQYGCTDLNYQDESCPRKCGWDPANSPWIGLEYCNDIQDLTNTWTCLSPESCGCEWNGTYALQLLPSRGCGAMGSEARIGLYAPSTLLPYISLPPTAGGSTGYYSTTTNTDGSVSIISTAVNGYTPAPSDFTLPTTYRAAPTTTAYINQAATASPSTLSPASVWTATTPPAPAGAGASNPTASSAQSGASASPTSTSSSGLSTGAKAGIGVGVAVGVLLLAGLGLGWFLAARRKRTPNNQPLNPQNPQSPQMQTMQPSQPPVYDMHNQQAQYTGFMQPNAPTNWAPAYPPGQMPYFVPPQQLKEPIGNNSPAYSPPHSPPPTELSAGDNALHMHEADSVYSGTSPRLQPNTIPDVERPRSRFSEGPM